MPCFVLTLVKKETVYRLSDLITNAWQPDASLDEAPVASAWQEINLQASVDNCKGECPALIKGGDKELSGLKYGYTLGPGERKQYSSRNFVSTTDKYFLCEGMDGAQMSVELL